MPKLLFFGARAVCAMTLFFWWDGITIATASAQEPRAKISVIELRSDGGRLVEQLKRQADSAAARGEIALLDIGAPWCPPCKRFEKIFSDTSFISAMHGVRMIHVDYDTWQYELVNYAGMSVSYSLPELRLLDPEGRLGGKFKHDELWNFEQPGKTDAEIMVPPLRDFLVETCARINAAKPKVPCQYGRSAARTQTQTRARAGRIDDGRIGDVRDDNGVVVTSSLP